MNLPQEIHIVNCSETTYLTEYSVLNSFRDVFEGLRHIGDSTIATDSNTKLVQHSPKSVPFVVLRDEVKAKLADLEKRIIIQKVTKPTDCINSMVIVAKPDKIRTCIDTKDLNKAIKSPK